jgi:hypothetical protein
VLTKVLEKKTFIKACDGCANQGLSRSQVIGGHNRWMVFSHATMRSWMMVFRALAVGHRGLSGHRQMRVNMASRLWFLASSLYGNKHDLYIHFGLATGQLLSYKTEARVPFKESYICGE